MHPFSSKTLGLMNQFDLLRYLKESLPKSWCVLEIGDFPSRSKPAFVFDQQSATDPECFMINVNSMNEYNVIIVYHRGVVAFHRA